MPLPRSPARAAALLVVAAACGPSAPEPARPGGAVVVDVQKVAAPTQSPDTTDADAGPPGPRAPRPGDEDLAKRLFNEGTVHYARGEYELAIERFRAAYLVTPKPDLLYDIGRALEKMGRNEDAAEVYEQYMHAGDLSYMDKMSMELRIKQLRARP